MRTGRRTLRLTVNVNLFDGRPRPTVGLPATNFYFHHGSVERNLSAWVNDNGRWAWEERGEPQLFEQPEHYKARRIRDRLTVAILAEYAGKLGLRPFDASFYSPDEEATIAEFSAPPGSRSTFHTLQDVQARIANGWYTEPRPW